MAMFYVGKYLVTWCLSHTNESNRQLCHKSSIILLLLLRHILCSLPISCHRFDLPFSFWRWWEDLATSEWFSNSLIKPPFIHTIEHLTQPCLWANQTKLNKHTEQTQMTGHSFTCSQTASSLKGKTNRAINVCSKPINDSGNGSTNFSCCAILDCIIFNDGQASILGLPC